MKIMHCALVALVLTLAPACAQAATVTTTVTGSISSGSDYFDFFGLGAGADLTGEAFEVVTVIDTDAGQNKTSIPGTLDQQYGGISAVLTINGSNVSWGGSFPFTFAQATTGGFLLTAGVPTNSNYNGPLDLVFSGPITPSLASLQSIDCASSHVCAAAFTLSDTVNMSFGTFDIANVTTAVTPIPAALPLFISALGGIGFVSYRRKLAREEKATAHELG
jgi:hypothetical protein